MSLSNKRSDYHRIFKGKKEEVDFEPPIIDPSEEKIVEEPIEIKEDEEEKPVQEEKLKSKPNYKKWFKIGGIIFGCILVALIIFFVFKLKKNPLPLKSKEVKEEPSRKNLFLKREKENEKKRSHVVPIKRKASTISSASSASAVSSVSSRKSVKKEPSSPVLSAKNLQTHVEALKEDPVKKINRKKLSLFAAGSDE